MNKNLFSGFFLIAVLIIASSILFSHPHAVEAHDPANITGYLWSDTIGWISLNCTNDNSCATSNYGVNENRDGTLTGYAWSDNVGWIKFGGLSDFPQDLYPMYTPDTNPVPRQENARYGSIGLYLGWIRACSGTLTGDCSTMTSRTDGWDGWISLHDYYNDGYNTQWYYYAHVTMREISTQGLFDHESDGKNIGEGSQPIISSHKNVWGSTGIGWVEFKDVQRARTYTEFDIKSGGASGTSIIRNDNVPSGTIPTYVWGINDPHANCTIQKNTKLSASGTTPFNTINNVQSPGTYVGSPLTAGLYVFDVFCDHGNYSRLLSFTVTDDPYSAGFDVRDAGGTSLTKNLSVPSGTVPTFVWNISSANCSLSKTSAGGTPFATMSNLTTSGTYVGASLTAASYEFTLTCTPTDPSMPISELRSYFTVVDAPIASYEFDVRSPGANGISLNGDNAVPFGTVPTFTWAVSSTNPLGNPQLTGSYDTSGSAVGTYISGNYAYVADADAGLQIIDISNPSAPTLKGNYNTPGAAHGVVVVGNYAYVADKEAGLQIIDVSNPSSPTLAGSLDTPGLSYELVVSGNYAYVADAAGGLQIINISNPASPTLTGTYVTLSDASQVALQGPFAYVASAGAGMQIIDVGNPSSPGLVATFSTSGYASGVDVSGNYAYVAASTSGLQIIDVSNPSSPALVGSYNTPGDAWEVHVYGNYAYVADMSAGFHIIDVSNPASPTLVGTYDTAGNVVDVIASGNNAYASDGSAGLQVFNVSTSENCGVKKIKGGTPINSSDPVSPNSFPVSGTGSRSGDALTISGAYEYTMVCISGAQPNVSFTVMEEAIQAFSLGGTETARIQFIGGNQADSEIRSIYVYPSGGFSYPVTISITGYPTPPYGTVFTYSLGGGEFVANPPAMVINSPYDKGVNFQMRSSKPITGTYTVTLTGTTDTQTAVKDIIILPKGFDPRYEQF